MKMTIKTVLAIAAAGAFAVAAYAQNAQPKIGVIDMANLYENHHKTVAQKSLIEADMKKAQEELQGLGKQAEAIVGELRKMEEDAKNPALTETAKKDLETKYSTKLQELQSKQGEINQLQQGAQRALQERTMAFREALVKEILDQVNIVAKEKGLNMVFDASGKSLNGISSIVYSDGLIDITLDVANRIKATAPAGAATAAPASNTTTGTPSVSFPAN